MIKFSIINSLQFILIPLVFFLVPLICHHMLKYIRHTWKPQSIRCLRNPIWHIFICTKDRNTNLLSTDDYTHLWCIEVLGALDGCILSKEQTIDHFMTLAILLVVSFNGVRCSTNYVDLGDFTGGFLPRSVVLS
jgi:hypothetical protein